MTVYEAINHPVLRRVPRGARRVLDLGCGTGALGRELKARQACEVVGVTHSAEEAEAAAGRLDEVLVRDLDGLDPRGLGEFDCVVCSHVLEHLCQPEKLLASLRACLSPGGVLVVALPNALQWRQRFEFARGRFRYTDGGLMDRTHLRFYDWTTARGLLEAGGYVVLESEADGGFPLSRYMSGVGRLLDTAALRLLPGMFGAQFILIARPARQ